MSKNTILLVSLAVILAGTLIAKEYISSGTISNEQAKNLLLPDRPNLPEPRPEKDSQISVDTSGMVTFILAGDDIIYYYPGKFKGGISITDFNTIGILIKKYKAEINEKKLMFIIKSAKEATFKNAVDILDQMIVNKIPAGHYAEVEITNEEITGINNFKAK